MSITGDVTFHAGWWHKNAWISFDEEFFLNPEYRIDNDKKMRKVLYDKFGKYGIGKKNPGPRPIMGSDLLASGYLYSHIMGCPVRFFDDTPPEIICAEMTDEQINSLVEFNLAEMLSGSKS